MLLRRRGQGKREDRERGKEVDKDDIREKWRVCVCVNVIERGGKRKIGGEVRDK